MSSLLFLLLFPSGFAGSEGIERLRHCIERRDRTCLVKELRSPRKGASAEYRSAAAEGYLLLGRKTDAIAAMEDAVRSKPGDYDLLMQQGRVYQRCGDQVHAIQAFLLASKVWQTSDVFYAIGISFFLVHEYERAGRHFTHAVQLDAKSHKSEFMLAVIDVLKDHNNEGAKKHLERALALAPDNPHYLLHYGIVLSELNDAQAGPVLEKAVKSDPSNPLAHFNLGRYYRRTGETQKAVAELEIAVRMRPQLARAHYQLAGAYRSLGQMDKARVATEQFRRFMDEDRDDDPVDGPPSYAFHDQPVK